MFWIVAAFIWIWAMSSPKIAFFLMGVIMQVCAVGSISSLHSGGELLVWFLWCQGCAIFVWVCLVADGFEARAHARAMGWTPRSKKSSCVLPIYYPPPNYRQPVSVRASVTAPMAAPTATPAVTNSQRHYPAHPSGKSIAYIDGRFYEVDGNIRPLNP